MRNILIIGLMFVQGVNFAQDDLDLLKSIEDTVPTTTYATTSYKSTRIINSISLKNTSEGVLDLRISHRFGALNTGIQEFFGLDNAVTRIGFDYGVNPWLMIGIGRSTYEKAFDGFFKAKILQQSTGAKNMPLSVQLFSSVMINTLKSSNPTPPPVSTRMGYTFQLLLGRRLVP